MVDLWDFSGNLAVKTALQCNGILCQGAEILLASWSKQNRKQKKYCNKFNKDFLKIMVHIKEKIF